ncbi:hypothetical protein MAPG_03529 [Magnaporthiopsis poae ATCC 64411]|uniref:Uncharacterized protein n=1 Tax=Magnaporthiopsis poae (strain ATCC 64411 / 73-15) TaxID=644358 RepID=A0A0C4DU92_MAGP6|nr:hypothetical protein MAPG_03529 [Magnaporthiopsis poae ATCC 64411]
MCHQLAELYSECNCLYYLHPVDTCPAHGLAGHEIVRKTVHVGASCPQHQQGGGSDAASAGRIHSSPDIAGVLDVLRYKDLDLLWPQVIRLSGSLEAACRTVETLIQTFLDDASLLQPVTGGYPDVRLSKYQRGFKAEATEVLRFLLSNKLGITQSILGMHQPLLDPKSELMTMDKWGSRNLNICSPTSLDRWKPGIRREFSFLRAPAVKMQSRIEDYIRQQPRPNPITRPLQVLLVRVSNGLESLKQKCKPIRDGARRMEWTCGCGRKICDDYEPFDQEAANIVFSPLLKVYPRAAISPSSESSEGSGSQTATQAWKLLIPSFLKAPVVSLAPSLPQYNSSSPADPARLGVCPQPATTDPRGTHTFLLLCLPFMRTAIKLLEPEMCTIYSDREFFRALAHHYSASRRRTRWARLRKVRSLKFVEFEVFQSELVYIRQCPSLPPESRRVSEYTYQPALTVPPIGSNLLTHLFENPDHADVLPVLFSRIPKKLHPRLTACRVQGTSVGWGIQIDEGLNWLALLVWGSAGFLVCLVGAVAWALARDDV